MPDAPVVAAVAPTAPAIAPTAAAAPTPKPENSLSKKSYATKVQPRFESTSVSRLADAKGLVAAAEPTVARETPSAAASASTDGKVITPDTPAAPPAPVQATTDAPKVDAGELAKRAARLARQDERLRQERQKFDADKQAQTANLQRLQMIEQASKLPRGQRLDFIKRAFGWQPQEVIDDIIGEAAKTPEQRSQEINETMAQRMTRYEQELEASRRETQAMAQRAQVQAYVQNQIVPVIADEKAYAFARDEHGPSLPQVIYDIQMARYQKLSKEQGTTNPVGTPTPKQVADFLEKSYRDKHERRTKLGGQSVTAAQAANSSATGSATAITTDPQTRQHRQDPARTRSRGRPYMSKVLNG